MTEQDLTYDVFFTKTINYERDRDRVRKEKRKKEKKSVNDPLHITAAISVNRILIELC